MKVKIRPVLLAMQTHKVATGILLTGGLIFGYLLLVSGHTTRSFVISSTSAADRERAAVLQKDSDNDGLKDWEEQIFGTDPHNPDSDGDGTPDGEEIKEGRDPLKPGPNDKLATSTLAVLETGAPLRYSDNFTAAIATQFGEKYILPLLQNPNQKINQNQLANQLADQIAATSEQLQRDIASQITVSDIQTSPDNSTKAITQYMQSSQRITASLLKLERTSEITIFTNALERQDFSLLGELDPYLDEFERIVGDLKNLQTPADLAPLHIRYLTLAMRQREAVKKIRGAEADFIGALAGSQVYIQSQTDLQRLVGDFQAIAKKRGAIISSK